ncbi:uncharacterized protein MYCFIDRAFT_46603 [Pseudocercospora fijiensis CIRAD86]|uniref:Uncharacterized protein n=1 Tax=Pseudocercospora fijiensis (strain CIRAD86) TaxID=383855 RepID=M3B795_PSEFD|nr:uncharacterized protein MYCFIDRAFT_46603 [Pseudocercospora fijiensis CIRAD86]EME85187.1 hypothetical protein MYCFIDRAFT_46603 [Pseudocercospora fijiensis CIRAD86]
MSTYLITGTSRGIGLELVKQLIDLPSTQVANVFAVTRSDPSEGLQQLIDKSEGRIVNVVIDDISKEASVAKGVAELQRHGANSIDVLVNNAGIMPITPSIRNMSGDHLRDVLNVNLVSAHVMTLAFFPLLQKGREKKVINISTTMGSISMTRDYSFAPTHAYKIAKAGMNMLNAQWAIEFEKEGSTFLAVSPGWLQTDLGSQNADLPVSTGVESVKQIILNSTPAQNGKFVIIKVPGWEDADGPNKYHSGESP